MHPKQLVLTVASAATLLSVGFAFGHSWSPAVAAASADPVASNPSSGDSSVRELLAAARSTLNGGSSPSWLFTLARLPRAECAPVFDELGGLPDPQVRRELRELLVLRWMEFDPAAAATAVAALASNENRTGLAEMVLISWIRKNPEAALAWAGRQPAMEPSQWALRRVLFAPDAPPPARVLAAADALPPGELRDQLRTAAFARYVAEDAAAALTYANRQTDSAARANMAAAALAGWAKQDPAAALARAATLPDEQRQDVLAAVAAGLSARDPLEALPLLKQLPAGAARLSAAEAVVAAMAKEDPSVAAEFALTFPAGRMRDGLLTAVTNSFAADDAQAALRWVQSLPEGEIRTAAVGNLWRSIVRSDTIPTGTAATFALSLPANQRRNAVSEVVERMVAQDPAATAAWVQTLNDSEVRSAALGSLAENWPQRDLAGALAYARRLGDAADSREFLKELGGVAAENPSAIADQLLRLPAGAQRDAFARGAAQKALRRSPAEAAALVDWMGAGESREQVAASVARDWAHADPTAAAHWVASRPDLAADGSTCAAVASAWAQWDPAAAAAWTAHIPAGAGRSQAVVALVGELKAAAPAAVAPLVCEIADAQQRHAAITRLAAAWLNSDRATASAWLAGTDLSREAVQTLLAGQSVPDDDEVVVLSPCLLSSNL